MCWVRGDGGGADGESSVWFLVMVLLDLMGMFVLRLLSLEADSQEEL